MGVEEGGAAGGEAVEVWGLGERMSAQMPDPVVLIVNGEEEELRPRLQAPALNLTQDLFVSGTLPTGRVLVKDEDVCLHCGLCAERCPTGAWDMQKTLIEMAQAGGCGR